MTISKALGLLEAAGLLERRRGLSMVVDGGRWLGELLRVCVRMVNDPGSIEIIDEEPMNDAGDMAGAVFKLSEPLSAETFQQLSEKIRAHCLECVNARVLRGVLPMEMALAPEELSTEHLHLLTGISARSTAHRSRSWNDEEALFLRESLVRHRTEPQARSTLGRRI